MSMWRLDDNTEWYAPSSWPVGWRRLFILTLPVSGPIWLLAPLVLYAVFAPFGLLFLMGLALFDLWRDARP